MDTDGSVAYRQGDAGMKTETEALGCFVLPGSFTAEAMTSFFSEEDRTVLYFGTFEELVGAVRTGKVRYGILPIENSSTGGITEVYDLLRGSGCFITGEKCLSVEQYLMGVPGASIEDIRRVYSHPQGFRQSRDFFRRHPRMECIPHFSTAQSADFVGREGKKEQAAVAGQLAARIYGLRILAGPINMSTVNCTRFFVISGKEEKVEGADKITLVLSLAHEPGSLYRALGCFEKGGLNLMNLESRPRENHPFEYFFHIDVMGNLEDPAVHEVLEALQKNTVSCRILGNYRADRGGAS